MNFRRLDPNYSAEGKVGLQHGGKGEAEVWNEFHSDIERLSHAAELIRGRISSSYKEAIFLMNQKLLKLPKDELLHGCIEEESAAKNW